MDFAVEIWALGLRRIHAFCPGVLSAVAEAAVGIDVGSAVAAVVVSAEHEIAAERLEPSLGGSFVLGTVMQLDCSDCSQVRLCASFRYNPEFGLGKLAECPGD